MKVLNWINQKYYSEVLNKSQCISDHNQSTEYTHKIVYNNNSINSEAEAVNQKQYVEIRVKHRLEKIQSTYKHK